MHGLQMIQEAAFIMDLYSNLGVSLRSNKSEIAHTIVKFDTK